MDPQICFLIYLARSGSTLLAYQLDRYEGVGVTIEENIPDGIKRGKPVYIENQAKLDTYLDLLYHDEKFRAWQIDKANLKRTLLKRNEFPIQYNEILKTAHFLYFQENLPNVVIHKQGNYFFKVKQVKKIFPEAKFIFTDRDPRAIYNSQEQNFNSLTGETMSQGIVLFALIYKRLSQHLLSYSGDSSLYNLKYEDLVTKGDNELQKILEFLGLKRTEQLNGTDYFSRIPEKQKSLHSNVPGDFNVSRIDGWKSEMSKHRKKFLQNSLKKELQDKGYPLEEIGKLSIRESFLFNFWKSKFFLLHSLMKLTNWKYFSIKKMRFQTFGWDY